jgi:hypothetical protein
LAYQLLASSQNKTPYSLGLSATSQQYFSFSTNQPQVLFFQNKPATSQQYLSQNKPAIATN